MQCYSPVTSETAPQNPHANQWRITAGTFPKVTLCETAIADIADLMPVGRDVVKALTGAITL